MSKTLLEKLIVPVVIGVVIGIVTLLGQYFIQPKIMKNITQREEHWKLKQTIYIQAIKLVNQRFGSGEWSGSGVPNDYAPFTVSPTPNDKNNCYTKLLLVTKSKGIPQLFVKCVNQSATNVDRGKLISLMRKDLYKRAEIIPIDSIIFFCK